MINVVYISNSTIPSRTANSIHVMKMCQALASNGCRVTLLAPDNKSEYELGSECVFDYYGVDPCFEIYKLPWFGIKGRAYIYSALCAKKVREIQPDLVFGRDIIGCALSSFLKLPLIFESHSPIVECGILPRLFFNLLSQSKNLEKFVVITHALKKKYLKTHPHLERKIYVAPDGADLVPNGTRPICLPSAGKRLQVGYVGHLYQGKGMEVVSLLAAQCDWADFHVVGGLETDITYWKSKCSKIRNIKFHGYVPSNEVASYQIAFDVLLLPNQMTVTPHGGGKSNIGAWTSPLKLFEYMAASKPIIASDLPVLREVLEDERNALLCAHDNHQEWVDALERIRANPSLANQLGKIAYKDFNSLYTWYSRARCLIEQAKK